MRQVLPIAVAMLPINAAVYVFDGIITGASDFKFMAGEALLACPTRAVERSMPCLGCQQRRPERTSCTHCAAPTDGWALHRPAARQRHRRRHRRRSPACPACSSAGAMVLAAGTAAGLLLGVEPLELGLPGVWYALGLLMVSRLGTMMWRYQSEDGPLPPSGALRGRRRGPVAATACLPGACVLVVPCQRRAGRGTCCFLGCLQCDRPVAAVRSFDGLADCDIPLFPQLSEQRWPSLRHRQHLPQPPLRLPSAAATSATPAAGPPL